MDSRGRPIPDENIRDYRKVAEEKRRVHVALAGLEMMLDDIDVEALIACLISDGQVGDGRGETHITFRAGHPVHKSGERPGGLKLEQLLPRSS